MNFQPNSYSKSLKQNRARFHLLRRVYPPRRWLTLRLRLAFWTSGMFVILCLGLLVFINLTAGGIRSTQLEGVSLIGFVLTSTLGGLGAYWLAGVALKPVREVSQAAQQISANTLDIRLNSGGPKDELKDLTQAFNEMLDRLEGAFEQQQRFTADAAHELRTPLTTLRTNLEVVAADPQATLAEYQRMSAILQRSLNRLEQLVGDLLLLATEKQAIVCEAVALTPLLEDVLSELQTIAKAAQVKLYLEDSSEVFIQADRTLLFRLFANLVENSIRYNRPGGMVKINTCLEQHWLLMNVVDTGIGIAVHEQTRIFDRFYRVDQSRSRHSGGAGLGLAIVKHIAHQHGGQVELSNSSSLGSTFTVWLPRHPDVTSYSEN